MSRYDYIEENELFKIYDGATSEVIAVCKHKGNAITIVKALNGDCEDLFKLRREP